VVPGALALGAAIVVSACSRALPSQLAFIQADSLCVTDSPSNALGRVEHIERTILLIRDQKVMLDADLSGLYQVQTKVLVRAVKRNEDRFPIDFMFQLTQEEFADLRCHFGTPSRWGGRRYAPYAFTEQGVAMLSGVLRSPRDGSDFAATTDHAACAISITAVPKSSHWGRCSMCHRRAHERGEPRACASLPAPGGPSSRGRGPTRPRATVSVSSRRPVSLHTNARGGRRAGRKSRSARSSSRSRRIRRARPVGRGGSSRRTCTGRSERSPRVHRLVGA